MRTKKADKIHTLHAGVSVAGTFDDHIRHPVRIDGEITGHDNESLSGKLDSLGVTLVCLVTSMKAALVLFSPSLMVAPEPSGRCLSVGDSRSRLACELASWPSAMVSSALGYIRQSSVSLHS